MWVVNKEESESNNMGALVNDRRLTGLVGGIPAKLAAGAAKSRGGHLWGKVFLLIGRETAPAQLPNAINVVLVACMCLQAFWR